MNVSLNWIAAYLDFELPPLDELVAVIGAQLGGIETVTDIGEHYRGIVIVKIVACSKLETSDHLMRCVIDDGGAVAGDVSRDEQGYVQVITGAPNVRAGMYVAWLPPGVTVPSSRASKPLVMESRELRGAMSHGMLASAKELMIGDNHDGILELSEKVQSAQAAANCLVEPSIRPGDDFGLVYGLNDVIIAIENKMFTHRPDCFGILGVAREIAGILGHPFHSPDVYLQPDLSAGSEPIELIVRNEIPELVPRYVAQVFHDVKIGPSSIRMQSLLSRVGIRPVNNVVDITNYFMLLTGQPMHAYDYNKVVALTPETTVPTIVIRQPHDGETLTLLNGKKLTPRPQAIVIANESTAIGLGGVMGGLSTEVDAQTTDIILESASFDMYSIRRTSMAHGIFSEAVTRFNKGQSPLQNNQIIAWAAIQLQSDAAATAGQLIDGKLIPEQVSGRASLYPPIRIAVDFINHRLGLKLTPEAMARLLCNVEFRVDVSSEQLEVSAPFWRTDIELREDIVEEIGRLYGYDKLPISLPRRDIVPAIRNHSLERKNRIRSVLAAAGANEVLTYSFVHGKLLERVSQHPDQAFKLSNALSPDLQYYRFHALPSILDKVHQNIRAGYSAFALFELSKGHSLLHQSDDPDGLPSESEYLDLVYAASSSGSGSALYSARRYLDRLADAFGVSLTYQAMEQSELPTNEPYEVPRSAVVSIAGGPELGIIGELKSSVQAALKLPDYTAAFTISPEVLSEHLPSLTKRYQALSKYPKVEQDICFKVDGLLPYQSLYDVVCSELLAAKPDESHIEVRPLDIYQRDDDQAHRQITFRVSLTSYLQTLRAQDLSVLLDALSVRAGATLQAERV